MIHKLETQKASSTMECQDGIRPNYEPIDWLPVDPVKQAGTIIDLSGMGRLQFQSNFKHELAVWIANSNYYYYYFV